MATVSSIVGVPGGSDNQESGFSAGDLGSIPGSGRHLEKGMATHSNILAWRILWIEEPGRLVHVFTESDMTEQLTLSQYFCLGNSWDRGAWQATVHGVAKESDTA